MDLVQLLPLNLLKLGLEGLERRQLSLSKLGLEGLELQRVSQVLVGSGEPLPPLALDLGGLGLLLLSQRVLELVR